MRLPQRGPPVRITETVCRLPPAGSGPSAGRSAGGGPLPSFRYISIPAASKPFSNLKTAWFGSATRSHTSKVSVGG